MEKYKKIYPITFIKNVLDENTDENLYVYLSKFNHINVGHVKDAKEARSLVPNELRKKGMFISYHIDSNTITEFFDGYNNINADETDWLDGNNWSKIDAVIRQGSVADRPKDVSVGTCYFDTTMNKPYWWNGMTWVSYTEVDDRPTDADIDVTHRNVMNIIDYNDSMTDIADNISDWCYVQDVVIKDNKLYWWGNYNGEGNKLQDATDTIINNKIILRKLNNDNTKTFYIAKGTKEKYTLKELTKNDIEELILPTCIVGDDVFRSTYNPVSYKSGTIISVCEINRMFIATFVNGWKMIECV